MKTAGIRLLENKHTKFAHATAQDVDARCLCAILYNTEAWIMNRNNLHYQRSFYLSKPTESIPSQAHQLICEMLEINFSPVLLTVIEHIH